MGDKIRMNKNDAPQMAASSVNRISADVVMKGLVCLG
jgi:hypothetical protein